jgi:hypothetical protein
VGNGALRQAQGIGRRRQVTGEAGMQQVTTSQTDSRGNALELLFGAESAKQGENTF